jgi:hypothetical protein
MEGWTDNYLRVHASASEPLWNQISAVRLESLSGAGLAGTIL